MLEEKMAGMWANMQKWIEEGTIEQHMAETKEYYSKEVFPLVAVRAFFKGVGKLDEKAANTVLQELAKACAEDSLGLMALRGLSIPTTDTDALRKAHEKVSNTGSEGLSRVTGEGNTATVVVNGGCICPLVKVLNIEPTPNHCLCSVNCLKQIYETGLTRPVKVEPIETCNRGGNSCSFKMSWD